MRLLDGGDHGSEVGVLGQGLDPGDQLVGLGEVGEAFPVSGVARRIDRHESLVERRPELLAQRLRELETHWADGLPPGLQRFQALGKGFDRGGIRRTAEGLGLGHGGLCFRAQGAHLGQPRFGLLLPRFTQFAAFGFPGIPGGEEALGAWVALL